MADISRMKTMTAEDGTVVFIDPGTRKTKKNRHRHVKEGTPKKLRGTQVTRLTNPS